MCMSKVQHITGRKTGCNQSRPVFSVFQFFDKPCNWQPKIFRICATAPGGLVFFSWVQFNFGLFFSVQQTGPANTTQLTKAQKAARTKALRKAQRDAEKELEEDGDTRKKQKENPSTSDAVRKRCSGRKAVAPTPCDADAPPMN